MFPGKLYLPDVPQSPHRPLPDPEDFLITDNGPCHNLNEEGKEWLGENNHRLELHRLPPYSPEFNPMEPVWKVTRKMTTHNRFYRTVQVDAHVARLR